MHEWLKEELEWGKEKIHKINIWMSKEAKNETGKQSKGGKRQRKRRGIRGTIYSASNGHSEET